MRRLKTFEKLDNLYANAENFFAPVMREQVEEIKERLNRGIEVDGDPFAGYKDPSKFKGRRRPLQYAARLFDEAQIDVSRTSSGGVELSAKIIGTPATIAFYQDFMRDFIGYSPENRRQIVDGVMEALRKGYHVS